MSLQRTCVVCRKQESKENLIRFVSCPSEQNKTPSLVVDLTQTLPGRGVYCHGEIQCVGHKNLVGQLLYSLTRSAYRREMDRRAKKFSGNVKLSENVRRPIIDVMQLILEAVERTGKRKMKGHIKATRKLVTLRMVVEAIKAQKQRKIRVRL